MSDPSSPGPHGRVDRPRRSWLAYVLPPLILIVAVLGALGIYRARPKPTPTPIPQVAPLVRVIDVVPGPHTFVVESEGTVTPRTEITLIPEVGGRVVEVSPDFVAGGFFAEGDVLLRIESSDYRAAVAQAEAAVQAAELRAAVEEANAKVAVEEWERLGGGEASPLTTRQLQVAGARADLEAARAALEMARRNLDRCTIRAPFEGRIRTRSVDVGQVVSPPAPIATIYATDYAEVRLPLKPSDLAFLDVPLHEPDGESVDAPRVILRGEIAGREHEWEGRLVRTEGIVDPATRLLNAVVRVDHPYREDVARPGRPPLAIGLFVRAELTGRSVDGVVTLPRAALVGRDRVFVVDDADRLDIRRVHVLRAGDEAVIDEGLSAGDRVCLTSLDTPVPGMSVRVVPEPALDEGGADDGAARDDTASGRAEGVRS